MKKKNRSQIWFITLTDIFHSAGYGAARKNRMQALSKYIDIHLFIPFYPTNQFIKKSWFSSIRFHSLTDSIEDKWNLSWLFKYYTTILRIFNDVPKHSIIYTDSFFIPLSKLIFRNRYQFIFDYHGIWYKQLYEKGYRNKFFLHFIKLLEHKSLKMCSKIICIDRKIIDHLINVVNISPSSIKHISNGVDLQHFNKDIKTKSLRKALNILENDIVLFFSGSFRPWHGIDNLIEVLKILSFHNIKYKMLFVGDGPDRKRIEMRCKNELPNSNIIFTGQVSYDDLPKYISLADICLYFPKDIANNSRGYYGDPLKFYEWMAMNKAIVTINATDLVYRFSKESPILTANSTIKSFAELVKHLINDDKERKDLGKKGFEYVCCNNTWDMTAKKIYDFIINSN